jgi:alkanesulfonate monooxygenase SsuD/methylene tetrahydromethanopterin reductase-like flavin-dependent oxidoreductase (luciferase family)
MRPQERAMLAQIGRCSAVGSLETVTREIASFIEQTRPDELLLVSSIFDHNKRLRSFEIAAEAGADAAVASTTEER